MVEKSIEERYQKKTQHEHVLLRPDTYVGAIDHISEKLWVVTPDLQFDLQQISYVPALYKIFDEILVNAADNFVKNSNSQTYIKVWIDQANNSISVENNGKGIPVHWHKEEKMYVPEMVFGHLLTSDNYDDTERKVTGGRNGFGAKLTNIFSTKFQVDSAASKKSFHQVFRNNMFDREEPVISTTTAEDFTRITFWPDLAKFNINGFSDEMVSLLRKRVFDVAGTTSSKCAVFLNDVEIPVHSFKEYAAMYLSHPTFVIPSWEEGREVPLIYDNTDPRWEVIITITDGVFQQVSFVNSIATISSKGGTHVDHVLNPLIKELQEKLAKKNKGGMDIKNQHIKNHICVFINCLVENPSFSSQTKEHMNLAESKFGSKCVLHKSTLDQVLKSGIMDLILNWAKAKEAVDMKKNVKSSSAARLFDIPKLEDANDAGTRKSADCTLILTEGDSAKTTAVSGLSVMGRDKWGVFPLKGKVLNIRDASHNTIMNNQEIKNILKIIGLEPYKKYESISELRYGSVMIMTDQDPDGSHIKGLLINMFQCWWPELFREPGFIREFVTPIVKVTKGKTAIPFFTLNEYEEWCLANNGGAGWRAKYYKGLGTSTAKEAKEYFSDMVRHTIEFQYNGEHDDRSIDLAFNKKRADDRKTWINEYDEKDFVDHNASQLSYSDFVHKELVQFAKYDVHRSIPNFMDGCKPTQRKILWGCFKRKLYNEMKVAQLAGHISDKSSYHHGEVSMMAAIVNMAQDFVGSNNVNFLMPNGQFGSRLMGGKDSASERYIFTCLNTITRKVFHPLDDDVLEYQVDDGQNIEPKFYVPVVPTVLFNGADGIGTGWSTKVHNFNPSDVVAQCRKFIRNPENPEFDEIVPWYKGFAGDTRPTGKFGIYECVGKIRDLGMEAGLVKLEITELPVKTWTTPYKEEVLEKMMMNEDQIKQFMADKKTVKTKAKTKAPKAKAKAPPLPKGARSRAPSFVADSDDEGSVLSESNQKQGATMPLREYPLLESFREYHTDETVHFICFMTPEKYRLCKTFGLEKIFRLRSNMNNTNMYLFDESLKIHKFESVASIFQQFCPVRLEYYHKRKAYILANLRREEAILRNKVRFIQCVMDGEIVINRRKRAQICEDLVRLGFDKWSTLNPSKKKVKVVLAGNEDAEAEDPEDGEKDDEDDNDLESSQGDGNIKILAKDYDYLVGMPLWALTMERSHSLQEECQQKMSDALELEATSVGDLWEKDLDDFMGSWEEIMSVANKQAQDMQLAKIGNRQQKIKDEDKPKNKGKRGPPKPKANATKKENTAPAPRPSAPAPRPSPKSLPGADIVLPPKKPPTPVVKPVEPKPLTLLERMRLRQQQTAVGSGVVPPPNISALTSPSNPLKRPAPADTEAGTEVDKRPRSEPL